MTVSRFRLQIIDTLTGKVAHGWQPGDKVETDLVGEFVKRLTGVGLFTREKVVKAHAEIALTELIHDLKARV